MKKILLASAAIILSGTTAFAGNLFVPAPSPVPYAAAATTYDWSGAYVGGYVGGDMGTMEYFTPSVGPYDIDAAWAYGGFVGYNWQSGNLVYGVEAAAGLFEGFPAGWPAEGYDYIIDARVRVGHAMDNVLLYGFGGGSLSSYTIAPDTWSLYGANFGAGVEFGVTDNVTIGGEYIGRFLTGETDTPPQTQDTWLHGLQLRASLRF